VKVVKITPHINDHDLHWRSGQTIDWLNSGHQVKLRIQTYGRVGEKADVINAMYEKFFGLISKSAKIQVPLKKLSPVLHEAIFVKTKS
jgi:translation initiation factor IF-3